MSNVIFTSNYDILIYIIEWSGWVLSGYMDVFCAYYLNGTSHYKNILTNIQLVIHLPDSPSNETGLAN